MQSAVAYHAGLYAVRTGDRATAKKHFLVAVDADPSCAAAHFNFAVLLATAQPPDFKAARDHYDKAVELGRPPDSGLDKLFGIEQWERQAK